MKYANDAIMDAGLNEVKNNATLLTVCSQPPTTRTEAVSTFMLADIAIDSGDFTGPANGDTDGRKVTVGAQSGVTVDNSGIGTHIAIVDGIRLLYVTEEATVQHSGTAQAGASTTITLAAGATATDDIYNGYAVKIIAGTGVGQTRMISDYVGSTRVATVSSAWGTNPDNTSEYEVFGFQLVATSTVDIPAFDIEIGDPAQV